MTDRIDGIIDRVSDAEEYEKASWLLGVGVLTNFALSIVDDSMRDNLEFQGKAGVPATVKRYTIGYCCDWCQSLVGTYNYPDVPKEVWQRHRDCNCIIEYTPGKTGKTQYLKSGRQNWYEIGPEELEQRKNFAGINTASLDGVPVVNQLVTMPIANPPAFGAVGVVVGGGVLYDSISEALKDSDIITIDLEETGTTYDDLEAVLYKLLAETPKEVTVLIYNGGEFMVQKVYRPAE